MTRARGAVRVYLDANTDGIVKGTARAERELTRSESGGQELAALKGAAATTGLALAGSLVVGLKQSVDAAVEAEAAQARLKAQLNAQGFSYRAHAADIEAVIQKHSRLAALDDEDLQDAFVNIIRTTGSVSQSMRLVGLAADIARAKNMDVAKAGELVGKVAGGNTGILSRYGIVLKDNATKEEALAELQKRFAGQAEKYGRSSASGQDRFRVTIERLKEALGVRILPWVVRGTLRLSEFVEEIEQGEGEGGRFVRRIERVIAAARRISEWLGDHKSLVAGVVAAWGIYRTKALAETATTAFVDVFPDGRSRQIRQAGRASGQAWGRQVRLRLYAMAARVVSALRTGVGLARAVATGSRFVPGPISLAIISGTLSMAFSRIFPEARYGEGPFRGTGGPRDYGPAVELGEDIADFLGIGAPPPGAGRVTAPLSPEDDREVTAVVEQYGPRLDDAGEELGISGLELLSALVVHTGAVAAPAEILAPALDMFTRRAARQTQAAKTPDQADAALAAAEATATKADDLKVKEQQRKAVRARIERIKRALERGGMRGSTEQRLTQELASKRREHKTLTDEIVDLRQRGDEADNTQRLTDIYDVMSARAEGTEDPADDRRVQGAQLGMTSGRIKEIRKALKNPKLREETRSRLQQELAQRIREQQSLKSAVKPTYTRQDYDDAFAAQAALTPDLQDDMIAAARRQNTAMAGYQAAVASGDPRRIADAAAALKAAGDELKAAGEAIKQAAYTGFEDGAKAASADLIRAQVGTPEDKADDEAALRRALANAEAAYNQAVNRGDTDQIVQWGGEVLALRGSVAGLGAAVDELHAAQLSVTKARREQAERLHRQSQAQYEDLGDLLTKYLASTIGAKRPAAT